MAKNLEKISTGKTEIWYGLDNFIAKTLECISRIKECLDICGDSINPCIQVSTDPIREAYFGLKQRGIKIRFVTEITKENIHCCKKVMEFAEVRHLEKIVGNFGVSERDYIAAITGENKVDYLVALKDQKVEPLSHAVYSNVKSFVEHQQFFFETLWNIAIPAKERIKEIEVGAKREFIETIRDHHETEQISFELLNAAMDEIQMMLPTANAFRRQQKAGLLQLLEESASRGIRVRILVPMDDQINEIVQQLKDQKIVVRDNKKLLQSRLAIMVVDQSRCLAVELKDDTKQTSHEAMGLATYSNSESTILTYASIFETLWAQAEVKDNGEERKEKGIQQDITAEGT